jgi:apolipoprotein N-acyltransferase
VFLLSPAGEEIDRYYKIHLVPVSEYFPLKRYLPASWQKLVTGISDWNMGSRYTIFSAPPAKFGVVICFESVFPELFRKFVAKGVNLMGIITNDAWFRGTYAPEQHYSMAPFRAVENRVAVFRCANYGISCIIDPWGRVSQKLEPDSDESYLVGEVYLRQGGTFYTRHGDYLPWACLAMALFLAFQTWWYRRSR